MAKSKSKYVGAVMVLGGGVAGINAALQLADEGYYVYLVEKNPALGGTMIQLSRTFSECFCCQIYPQAYSCLWNPNVEILTLSQVDAIEGEAGNFTITLTRKPRYVREDACNSCAKCVSVCPVDVTDSLSFQEAERKAIFKQHPFAIPMAYVIDSESCLYVKDGSCGDCAKACPQDAINLDQKEERREINVGAVVFAPGFELFDPSKNDILNYQHPNVITGKEFERITSALGSCGGRVRRPSDGEVPKKVAWILCVGSRDINRCDNPHCSSVCCMYSMKEAYEMRKSLGEEFQGKIFYMDLRAFGKGWEEYYNEVKEAGIEFIRCRIHTVTPLPDGNLELSYLDQNGNPQTEDFELVVLATGMEPAADCVTLAEKANVEFTIGNFVETPSFNPTQTSVPGIYVTGTFQAPKDIYDSILDARAAATDISRLLSESRYSECKTTREVESKEVRDEEPQIGVFFLGFPAFPLASEQRKELENYAKGLPSVKFVSGDAIFENPVTLTQNLSEAIRNSDVNRVVAVSAFPQLHEEVLKSVMVSAGLNPLLLEVVDLRDTGSMSADKCDESELTKVKDLLRMATTRAALLEPHEAYSTPVVQAALVIGGGLAGLVASLNLAEDGYDVFLVEKTDTLGGNARYLNTTWKNENVQAQLDELVSRVENHEKITVFRKSEVKTARGAVGNFESVIVDEKGDTKSISYGAAVIATGGYEYKPSEYLYGKNENVLTLFDLDEKLKTESDALKSLKTVAFIHCVGSREPERPYCSRVCCTHSIEDVLKLKELNPDLDVYVLYRQMRTYGLREQLFLDARHQNVKFIQYGLDDKPDVSEENGRLKIVAKDPILGMEVEIDADMLVLASAVVPNDSAKFSKLFHVPLNDNGFFKETKDEGLRFTGAKVDGVFFCGIAHYPKSIDETVTQAQAVAGQVATLLRLESISLIKQIAVVDPDFCAACCTCVRTCPYEVPIIGDEGVSEIDPARCMGCGACVTECPGKAITLQNFSDQQMITQIDALLSV